MRSVFIALAMLAAYPAFAEDKSVTLTDRELNAIIEAQVTKAIAQYVAEREAAAINKVNKAFAPTPPAPPAPPH